ncbi:GNAT family N-acetyltransferase [Maledivibacter halophilus]|uniref:Protein N-acetyltransferase, RimJ/RimL family n=1 Tax=Maledivibacter halophilus TaxID=36842 RepID=A0A1T5L0M5_9FIRM|nr:GNAT family protein [Maledivibacter halophilus]SKC69450.1 Protein N-acetyltransferase, RimJ/RimL family [Maledivibacter halophilus]
MKYTEWLNDLELGIHLVSAPQVIPLSKEREILERLSVEGYNFAIVDFEKDELLGNCGLLNVDFINRTAELGIFIGNKEYWNRGLGQEAIELILNFGFNIINLNNIMLRVRGFNKRAIKCYEKCGFKVIGIRREAITFGDKKYGEIYMDILASEFKGDIVSKILENFE